MKIESLGDGDLPMEVIVGILNDNFRNVFYVFRDEKRKPVLIRACEYLMFNPTVDLLRSMFMLDPGILRFMGECEYLFFVEYLNENKPRLEAALNKSIEAFAYEGFGFSASKVPTGRYEDQSKPHLYPYRTLHVTDPCIDWGVTLDRVAQLANDIQRSITHVPPYIPYFTRNQN